MKNSIYYFTIGFVKTSLCIEIYYDQKNTPVLKENDMHNYYH